MSEWLPSLLWHNPWWLLLLLLPLAMQLRNSSLKIHPRLERFIQRHLWTRVLSTPLVEIQQRGKTVFMLVWILLCLALAGPYLLGNQKQQISRLAANVVVVLDISPSMGAEDVRPSRLSLAQQQLIAFSRRIEQHRLALISFSANAYTVLPLSSDAGAWRHFVAQMDPSLAFIPGSNVSRALDLSREALAAHPTAGLVLLISDGEFHDQNAAASAIALQRAGHRLITLGVGTQHGAPVPLAKGRLVRDGDTIHTSQLQRASLMQLAQAGGGQYFDLNPDAWSAIESEIGSLQRTLYQTTLSHRNGQPLFPFLIAAALLLLMWQTYTRTTALTVMLTALVVIQPDTVDAAPWNEAQGLQQLRNNDYAGALQTYRRLDNYTGLMGRGVAAYGLGQWQDAMQLFNEAFTRAANPAEQARAAYNQGNALIRLQRFDEAANAFELAIRLQGSYPRAARNLMLVNQARQEWGGLKQSDDEQTSRPGLTTSGEESEHGAGGSGSTTPISAQSETGAALSTTRQNRNGQHQRQEAALTESLAQWSLSQAPGQQTPLRAMQQYRNLREDDTVMLQRRFEIEDKRAFGQVDVKPW